MTELPSAHITRIAGASTLGLLMLLLVSCAGGGEPCPEPEDLTAAACQYEVQPPDIAELQAGRIYLDTSESMEGYLPRNGSSSGFFPLQHLLAGGILDAFASVDVKRAQVSEFWFGRKPEPMKVPLGAYAVQYRTQSPRSRYTALQTNIIGALRDAALHPDQLSVVVTDNAQDLAIDDESVPGFAKEKFVRVVIGDLIDQGFGIWLVGVVNSFEGNYFSVMPSGIQSKTIPLNAPRPVYLWVATRHVDVGRRFVADVESRLRGYFSELPDGLVTAEPSYAIIELAPGLMPRLELEQPLITADTEVLESDWYRMTRRDAGLPRAASCLVYDPGRKGGGGMALPLTCWPVHVRPPVEFETWSLPSGVWSLRGEVVSTDSASETGRSLEQGIDWADLATTRESDVCREPNPGESDRSDWFSQLQLNGETLLTITSAEHRRLRIEHWIRADTDQVAAGHWLRAWSTRNDTRQASISGKTLYLEDVALGILDSTVGTTRRAACTDVALISR